MTPSDLPDDLPGLDLVTKGFHDLNKSDLTEEALLVQIHTPELTRLGLTPSEPSPLPRQPEYLLYRAIEKRNPENAHSTYNALNRRLTSFIHCLEQLASSP